LHSSTQPLCLLSIFGVNHASASPNAQAKPRLSIPLSKDLARTEGRRIVWVIRRERMMKRRVTCAMIAVGLAGCNAAGQPQPVASAHSNRAAIENQLLNAWNICVAQSYNRALTGISDKNEAAEAAFRACKAEEDELVALDAESRVPVGSWLHYKSQAKAVLIDKGVLPTL
jgi:hypothetical protein